jgi:hypothetical protein
VANPYQIARWVYEKNPEEPVTMAKLKTCVYPGCGNKFPVNGADYDYCSRHCAAMDSRLNTKNQIISAFEINKDTVELSLTDILKMVKPKTTESECRSILDELVRDKKVAYNSKDQVYLSALVESTDERKKYPSLTQTQRDKLPDLIVEFVGSCGTSSVDAKAILAQFYHYGGKEVVGKCLTDLFDKKLLDIDQRMTGNFYKIPKPKQELVQDHKLEILITSKKEAESVKQASSPKNNTSEVLELLDSADATEIERWLKAKKAAAEYQAASDLLLEEIEKLKAKHNEAQEKANELRAHASSLAEKMFS